MAYCLTADVLGILPGLPQTTSSQGYTETSAVVDSHITRADAVINGKCARRYSIPFAATATSTPPLIRQISQDITSWMTYRSLFTRDSKNRSEYLEDLYKNAWAMLDEIMAGKIDIVSSTGAVIAEVSQSNKIYSTTESYTPFFGQDDELEWKFDSDLIDAWGSARD